MIGRRTPRAPVAVLGGIGAGAVLAMAAPLTPLGTALPGPDGPVAETVPLRAVGAASAALPTADVVDHADRSVPPPAFDAAGLARAAFAGAAADPGFPARSAQQAAEAFRAAAAAAVAEPRPAPAPGPRAVPDRVAAGVGVAGLSGQLARVVELTNAERAQVGCAPLTHDRRITAAAQAHSDDMAANGYFAHDSRDGRDFADRLTAAGYDSPGAENIAMGQPDAATVVQDWMESPGHRKNILDCSLRTIGIGLADGYWTQDFGR
ncbi:MULTISPECIES: CAP domain-containing protein [unclassified Pseudonocardia]|uniref:CAP domain-containing protein n=1 Tax=unclassified Pseudonocardia TaxID=2619320 RepID=UPI002015EDCC|nr:CAP domain-containing protein [Pseudonocardia sp. Ae707_Ps1]